MNGAARTGGVLATVERIAWWVPLSSRRLFLALALVAVGTLGVASLTASWVVTRNEHTMSEARETGLGIAGAAIEFRTNLASADAQAASILLAGGLERSEDRASYVTDLLRAAHALTDAAVVATEEDVEDLGTLSAGLVTYAGLVETSRANSRQGFPVASSYLAQARSLANEDLVPRAERLRREGERRVARAANRVGGPVSGSAVAGLTGALLVLVGVGLVVAGRTRRLVEPALLAAGVAAVGGLAVVTTGVVQQSRHLRAAATTDIGAYVAANDAAFRVSRLRVTEIAAVSARGSGRLAYEKFSRDAGQLVRDLRDEERLGSAEAELQASLVTYRAAVDEVAATDLDQGRNREAAELTLDGPSADSYRTSTERAAQAVDRAATDLGERFEAAEAANVAPTAPTGFGALAAGLAGTGVLARGRRYR